MRNAGALLVLLALWRAGDAFPQDFSLAQLGKEVFFDSTLSRDGKVSCSSCHQPEHAYAGSTAVATGFDGQLGTRNAPSLLGVARLNAFFWDGRQDKLDDVVLQPFTNPKEMGLSSLEEVITRLEARPTLRDAFRETFHQDDLGAVQIKTALVAFVGSLSNGTNLYDLYVRDPASHPLSPQAQLGLDLFAGKAGCSSCHRLDGSPAHLVDSSFHHSSQGWQTIEDALSAVAPKVVSANLEGAALGDKIASDVQWAALGRFVATHKPADIGAFRTPSLRNVAKTGPYMHDGSVASLEEAIDFEIYYHSPAATRPINVSPDERRALLMFLEALNEE